MARVLVTRPEPGATATARRLEALGHEAILLPLSEIRPLDPPVPTANGIDAIAATSANALRHLPTAGSGPLLQKPCFTVGDRTGEAARDAGFSDVRSSEADGRSLAALIAARMPPKSRILYLCGRIRRAEFETEIKAAGLICVAVEVYETAFPEPDPAAAAGLLDVPPDAVLVYSARSAEALKHAMRRPNLSAALAGARFLCLSETVARALGTVGEGRTYWNRVPSEETLFELLAQH